MSKFRKALRQAEQDAAIGRNSSEPDATAENGGDRGSALARYRSVRAPAELPIRPRLLPPEPATPVPIEDGHLVSLISPAAFEAEQYRALRHTVEEMHKAAGVRVVAISSPAVGDGKTTTAINLAGALAQSPEAKVLLVDADLRRPSIGPLLHNAGAGPGLVEAILNPACPLDAVLVVRPGYNLSFIHSGRSLSGSPYELLKSARLGEFLQEARARFDYVILDTPPLAAVQDSRLIARWVDGFLIVVAANRTPRRLIEEALAVIETEKVLGLVFNEDTDCRHNSYYGYDDSPPASRPSLGRAVMSRAARWRRHGERR
jgi:capsular exopolysaccharide synthesis family protein